MAVGVDCAQPETVPVSSHTNANEPRPNRRRLRMVHTPLAAIRHLDLPPWRFVAA